MFLAYSTRAYSSYTTSRFTGREGATKLWQRSKRTASAPVQPLVGLRALWPTVFRGLASLWVIQHIVLAVAAIHNKVEVAAKGHPVVELPFQIHLDESRAVRSLPDCGNDLLEGEADRVVDKPCYRIVKPPCVHAVGVFVTESADHDHSLAGSACIGNY